MNNIYTLFNYPIYVIDTTNISYSEHEIYRLFQHSQMLKKFFKC